MTTGGGSAGRQTGAIEGAGDRIRIGELSRRRGLSPDVLRVWERRYGLLKPTRTKGGFRLYSDEDEARVAEMQQLIDAGYPASAAARLTLERARRRDAASDDGWTRELQSALERFDDRQAEAILDRELSKRTIETVLRGLLSYLNRLGERWARGDASVAQEHFASTLIRARLLALGRGWGGGSGPRAVLACPAGEHHDIGLVCFGICLRQHGWSIAYLGQNTPDESIVEAADSMNADLVVISAVRPGPLDVARQTLSEMADRRRVVLCGAGASTEIAESIGATAELGDPIDAAARVVGLVAVDRAR